MPYTPKDWQDSPSTATPITAAELERIEAGVDAAVAHAESAHAYAATSHNHTGTYDASGTASGLIAAHHAASSADHDDRYYTESEADALLAGKAATSHGHTAADTSDFAEVVRDTIGAALVAGTNVTITPNDGADTITIAATAGGGGGAVDSVNGETGAVVLSAADVGADAAGTAAALVDDLSGVSNAATARTNLGLGNAATKNTGTTSGTVAAGDDARLTDARTPSGAAGGDLSGTFPSPVVSKINGVSVSGTPTAGQVPTATSGTAASWQTPSGGGGSSTGVTFTGSGVPTTGHASSVGDFYLRTDDTAFNGREMYGPRVATTSLSVTTRKREFTNLATLTTSAAHGLAVGQPVTVAGVGGSGYDGSWVVVGVPSATTFQVRTTLAGDEGTTATGGGSADWCWPVRRTWGRSVSENVRHPAISNVVNGAPGFQVATLPGSAAVGVPLPPPFAWFGTSGYIVGTSTSGRYTGADTTNRAYAFIDAGFVSQAVYAQVIVSARPTEANGKCGLVMAPAADRLGLEFYVSNDNKLRVDRNVFGSRTSLYTSTGTVAAGAILQCTRLGGFVFRFVESTSGTDVTVLEATGLENGSSAGVFIDQTTTGALATFQYKG